VFVFEKQLNLLQAGAVFSVSGCLWLNGPQTENNLVNTNMFAKENRAFSWMLTIASFLVVGLWLGLELGLGLDLVSG